MLFRSDDYYDYPQSQYCTDCRSCITGIGWRSDRFGEVQGMRSYLGLIPASAKVRKRQNRMTILCIIISVLLVTTIFSVADMFIRTESGQLLEKHGSWHIKLETVSKEAAEKIAGRSDVLVTGWLEAFNTDADQPFYVGEKKAALYGTDYNYMTQLVNAIDEGHFPENDDEAVLSSNAKLALNVQIGD